MRFRHLLLAVALCPVAAGAVQAAEFTGTLKKIRDTGTITIGYREASVPFAYLDDKQQPVGYALDICYRVVDTIKAELKLPKLEVRMNPVTGATRIPLMANGTIDLECGSTTNNAEREKQVAFSYAHYLTANRFVSKKAKHIATIAALRGRQVASTSGTTNLKELAQANADLQLDIAIMPAKEHADAFLMLETDRVDAFVMDDILLAGLIASAKDPSAYVISDEAFSPPQPYAIMMRRNDPQFKSVVDRAVAGVFKTEGPKLFAQWFQSPIPPKSINLHVALAGRLQGLFAHPSDSPDPADYH
jgi:glutamate/aspartate transport system substrate-binding protein